MHLLVNIYIVLIVLDVLFILGNGVWLYFSIKKYRNATTFYDRETRQKQMLKPGVLITLGILIFVILITFLKVITSN